MFFYEQSEVECYMDKEQAFNRMLAEGKNAPEENCKVQCVDRANEFITIIIPIRNHVVLVLFRNFL